MRDFFNLTYPYRDSNLNIMVLHSLNAPVLNGIIVISELPYTEQYHQFELIHIGLSNMLVV
jgi:hypothetical protein